MGSFPEMYNDYNIITTSLSVSHSGTNVLQRYSVIFFLTNHVNPFTPEPLITSCEVPPRSSCDVISLTAGASRSL